MRAFSDVCGAWAKETEARLEITWRRSIELLADELTTTVSNGGRMPHKTGNLARSLLASTSGVPTTGSDGQRFTGQDVGVVVAGLSLGDPIYLGFQAAYARRMNYGFVGTDSLGRSYNQEGFHFVEGAIALWPTLVELAVDEVKSRSGD